MTDSTTEFVMLPSLAQANIRFKIALPGPSIFLRCPISPGLLVHNYYGMWWRGNRTLLSSNPPALNQQQSLKAKCSHCISINTADKFIHVANMFHHQRTGSRSIRLKVDGAAVPVEVMISIMTVTAAELQVNFSQISDSGLFFSIPVTTALKYSSEDHDDIVSQLLPHIYIYCGQPGTYSQGVTMLFLSPIQKGTKMH